MKIVMTYEVDPAAMPKAMEHFAAHRARLTEFNERGTLLMAGPWANPMEGALAVFTTREAAEAFVQGDPFVQHGIVTKWTLREWNEVLT